MRVLLTGSTGWLGRYLAPMLRAAGHQVTGLDVTPGPDTQVVGSVADRALVERTMLSHGIEGVIHAAALHKPDIVRYPRQAFIDVNVTGTLNLLEEAAAAGVGRFVFTSTTSLMIMNFVDLISYVSQFTTLKPGDVISTGTPVGTGMGFDPPKWLKAGDVVEINVPELGTLRNEIRLEKV